MNNLKKCDHCNEDIIIEFSSIIEEKRSYFCCQGCQTVFEILHAKKLEDYYEYRSQSDKKTFSPVKQTSSKFKYLDSQEFINKYVTQKDTTYTLSFYLEGIHCLACLWLIEKLPEFIPNVLHSQLNMAKSVVEVTISENGKFSQVAKQLETLGYPPHPIMENRQVEDLRRREDHKDLIKIAISFFCAGNIMLMSFSVYAGASGGIKQYFDLLSIGLSLPVITYCASSFYKNAYLSLKNKILSIDFPIVVALILGSILSIYSTFNKANHIYFDSLAILIFLLLTSRFFLKKMQQKGLSASNVTSFFSTLIATRLNEGTTEEVFSSFLNTGDTIIIKTGETIPADSEVIDGVSSTNNSLLTGESLPVKVTNGDPIYSGTINIDSDLVARVLTTAEDSNLGTILKTVEKGWNKKTQISRFTDIVSKYFVISVFILSSLTFLYFLYLGDIEAAVTRSLTLIIITCPCALGLTTPLSLTLTLAKLARMGIVVKDESVIEHITKSQNIIFDKTGTLTKGNFEVFKRKSLRRMKFIDEIIYSLEKKSTHPIAVSIKNSILYKFQQNNMVLKELEYTNYKEVIGVGPSAIINGKLYELKSLENSEHGLTEIGLFEDSEIIEEIYLKDTVKDFIKEDLSTIKSLGLTPFILSGDNQSSVDSVAKAVNIKEENSYGAQSPQDKENFIANLPHSIMVGDGANDAIALSKAWVGIAVHGSVDIALRASNVFMAENNLQNISKLIIASHETFKLIKRNLIFSLLYNILGSILAILGFITPLTAAVLMPLSSFTVLVSTLFSTKKLRNIHKT